MNTSVAKKTDITSTVESKRIVGEMEQAALDYLKLGWSIVPITPGGKRPHSDLLPLDENGEPSWSEYKERKASRAEVRGWFLEDPNTNIAVICGEASKNLVIVDVDAPELAKGLHLPPTWCAVTSRGAHYYYVSDKPIPSKPMPWGEIRSTGNYTVLPPSIHPSGVRYEWADCCDPFSMPIERLPESLALLAQGLSDSLIPNGTGKEEESSSCPTDPVLRKSEKQASVGFKTNSTLQNWLDFMRDEEVALAIIRACGAKHVRWNKAKGGRSTAFKCVLPGHKDNEPSATLVRCGDEDTRKNPHGKANAGVIMYHDWHNHGYIVQDDDGNDVQWFQEWYQLGEVYAACRSGQLTRLGPGEKAIWTYRALLDLGFVKAPDVMAAAKLPGDVKPIIREVYEGFKLLIAARTLYDPSQSHVAPYSHRFAAMWIGRSAQYCGPAIKWLLDHRYLRIVKSGNTVKASLITFGTPKAKGEKSDETSA